MICPTCGLKESLDYFYPTVSEKVACPDCGDLFDPADQYYEDIEDDQEG